MRSRSSLTLVGCLLAFLLPAPHIGAIDAAAQDDSHELAVFYAIPNDIPFEQDVYDRMVEATLDVQAWYQAASGGLTWELAFPEVVRVYNGEQPREHYDNQGWWGPLPAEMSGNGLPIWSPGTVTVILARGAGWWAGAASSCGGDCGQVLLGIEAFPEFNVPEWSGDDCPGTEGPSAWPCTAVGAYAHELGHTVGLPHPFDVPELQPYAGHSIMATHWNYPDFAPLDERPWGFLTAERDTIRANAFMHLGIELTQIHDTDIVNLPEAGPSPSASFVADSTELSVSFTNASVGASLSYWSFGDGSVSTDRNPTHTYATGGTYRVALRVSNDRSMMDVFSATVRARSACTIIGTSANDVLVGTDGADVICGRGGNDIIYGRNGDDELRGGDGHDRIYGGFGVDVLKGNAGNDRLVAGAQDDFLLGGPGDDVLRGKGGDDLLEGATGNDALYGARGNDTLVGGVGTDDCNGGRGTNTYSSCE